MPNPLQTLIEDSITKGLVEGRQESLRDVLQARFGVIPDTLRQRITAADVDELGELVRRAATIERIEDL